jgi:uncharacterized protein (TIGR00299 family) protein
VIGWIDASSGASGDMMLGALLGADVPLAVIAGAVHAVAPEAVTLTPEAVTRNGFAATRCHVEVAESTTRRTWADVAELLAQADLAPGVRQRAHATFTRLAHAEATVHGIPVDDVAFHEVGALDAIADVVGVCAGLEHLELESLVASAVAVGSGTVTGAHGTMPVPPPAVAELLRMVLPSYSGDVETELCTPTGAALLTANTTSYSGQPAMSVQRIGVGAGSKDPPGHANVLRLLVGEPLAAEVLSNDAISTEALVLETNVDDLDPRLWPNVIEALLRAGAADAWLTPILMKKGRPAHTLSVLVEQSELLAVRAEIFRQTSTIGLRQVSVAKHALRRETRTVSFDGDSVRVKLAVHDGVVVNAQPEYDDVAAVARSTGRPVREVLAEAVAASRQLHG